MRAEAASGLATHRALVGARRDIQHLAARCAPAQIGRQPPGRWLERAILMPSQRPEWLAENRRLLAACLRAARSLL